THSDYSGLATEAARRVLVELPRVLGAYSDRIVLVGGSVPPLLLPKSASEHVGTIDVDLAIDHTSITGEEYKEIEELLLAAGYVQGEKSYVFLKTLDIGGSLATVQVELLAGQYNGTGKRHRTQRLQGIRAMKMRGCDLAFQMCQEVKIEGILPNGACDFAMVRVPTMAAYLSMKGIALAGRRKLKDAYDIYFCIANCEDLDALADEVRSSLGHKLIREGIENIADKFASERHVGPMEVAEFDDTADEEAKPILRQDAYQVVNRLIERLGL
ncbi:MAG: hypothetical protein PHT33_10595, partial [bacterium]|nr:hypothetical protein [bacterium]